MKSIKEHVNKYVKCSLKESFERKLWSYMDFSDSDFQALASVIVSAFGDQVWQLSFRNKDAII